MKVRAKIAIRYAQNFAFTDKHVVVSGMNRELGVYDVKSGKQLNFVKDVILPGDGRGLAINYFRLPTHGIEVGFAEHFDGIGWYSFKTNRVKSIPHVEGKLGLMPVTRFLWHQPASATYLQLVQYSYFVGKGLPKTRSVVHCRFIATHSEVAQIEVPLKPRKNGGPHGGETAVSCFLTSDEVVVATTDYRDRIIGTEMRTGKVRFDKRFKTEFATNENVCHIPGRRAIAIAIGGSIQVWDEDLAKIQSEIRLDEGGDPLNVNASPDGTMLSVGGVGSKSDLVRVFEI